MEISLPKPIHIQPSSQVSSQPSSQTANQKKLQYVTLVKSSIPDAYRVIHKDEDKGLLAVRSMDMSKKLRALFQKQDQCVADVEWFEPFQKYELSQLYIAA